VHVIISDAVPLDDHCSEKSTCDSDNTGHRMYVHFTHASSIWAHPTCRRSHPRRRRSGQAPRTDRCHRRIRRHDKWAGLPGWPRPVATARAVQIPCCRVSLKTSKQVICMQLSKLCKFNCVLLLKFCRIEHLIVTVCFTNSSNPNHAPRDWIFCLQNRIKHNLYFSLTGKESRSNDVREEKVTTQPQVLLRVRMRGAVPLFPHT